MKNVVFGNPTTKNWKFFTSKQSVSYSFQCRQAMVLPTFDALALTLKPRVRGETYFYFFIRIPIEHKLTIVGMDWLIRKSMKGWFLNLMRFLWTKVHKLFLASNSHKLQKTHGKSREQKKTHISCCPNTKMHLLAFFKIIDLSLLAWNCKSSQLSTLLKNANSESLNQVCN